MPRKPTIFIIVLTLCLTLTVSACQTTSTNAIDLGAVIHQREVTTPENKAGLKNELDDLCLHKQTTPKNVALQKKWCAP